jgi:hypothetical protein
MGQCTNCQPTIDRRCFTCHFYAYSCFCSLSSTDVVSLVISMLLAVIAAYLHLGEYSLKVFGNAELAPLDGIAKIYSPKVSTVSVVFVKEGDAAIKGDKLCHNRTR